MTHPDKPSPKVTGSSDATPNRDRKREPVMIDATAVESIGSAPPDVSLDAAAGAQVALTTEDAVTEAQRAAAEAVAGPSEPSVATAEPKPAVAAAPESEPEARRPSRLPLVAALLGGAILAVGGSAAYQWYGGESDSAIAGLTGRARTLEEKIAAIDKRTASLVDSAALAALDTRLKALEQRPAPAPGALSAAPAAGAPTEALAALDRRVTAAEAAAKNAQTAADAARTAAAARPAPAPGALAAGVAPTEAPPAAPAVDLAPMQDQVAKLGARLATLETGLTTTRDSLATVEKSVAAPKVDARATETRVEPTLSTAGVAALGVVAQSLVRALDRGAPFAMELAALKSLGVEAPALASLEAVAAKGVQAPAALAAAFGPLAAQIAADTDRRDDSVLDRLSRSATNLVKIRPVDETAGDSPAAIVSRIEAALKRGDLAAAAQTWGALPESAKKISAAWAAALDARVKADKAALAIQADAIARLAQSKN